ncbi:MAG: peptidylprolyl isomerase [Microthrixaceae bacterium]
MGTDKRARQKEQGRTRAEQARKAAESAARHRRLVNVGVGPLVLALLVVGITLLTGNDEDSTASTRSTTTQQTDTTESTPVPTTQKAVAPTCPPATGAAARATAFTKAPDMCIDPAKHYEAVVDTSDGQFTITLDPAKAPRTVNNFVFLARYHFYDGTIFHRIIKDFMIQGGDPLGTGMGGPGYEFDDELPKKGDYQHYSIAMANSGPDTQGSQFFIVTGSQGTSLPPQYTLFGKVTAGTDTIDKIAATPVKTGESGEESSPTKKVTITGVTITES